MVRPIFAGTCLGASVAMLSLPAGAVTIGFEPEDGYTAGQSIDGQPSSGTQWGTTQDTILSVIETGGNPGQALQSPEYGSTALDQWKAATLYLSDVDGNTAPTTPGFDGQVAYSLDLAVENWLAGGSPTIYSWFFRFGTDDAQFLLRRDGQITFEADGNTVQAVSATGGTFDVDWSFGSQNMGVFFTIAGVIDYGTETWTISVNGVEQEYEGSTAIPFKTTGQTDNYFNVVAIHNNANSDVGDYRQITVDNLHFSVVPEPASVALLTIGGGMALLRRRVAA